MSTSNKVEFVWKDHELYDIRFNGETVCTLYKTYQGFWTLRSEGSLDSELETILVQTLVTDYWELLSEAKIAIRRALKSCY
jgi:hypothetical protein